MRWGKQASPESSWEVHRVQKHSGKFTVVKGTMNNVINSDEFVHCAIFSILFQYAFFCWKNNMSSLAIQDPIKSLDECKFSSLCWSVSCWNQFPVLGCRIWNDVSMSSYRDRVLACRVCVTLASRRCIDLQCDMWPGVAPHPPHRALSTERKGGWW